MKSIRTMLLVFAVTVVPFTAQRALAQQDVNPDHYDHPTAAKPPAMARSNQAAVQHQARSNANLASKQGKPSADIASNFNKPTSQHDPGRPLASGTQSSEANAAGAQDALADAGQDGGRRAATASSAALGLLLIAVVAALAYSIAGREITSAVEKDKP